MLRFFFDTIRIPGNDPNEHDPDPGGSRYENPIIINEYCWLWINRDGSPTRLTEPIYKNAFGEGLSSEEMLELYGRHMAIKTEYWRAHRNAAGVLHFCGLGYSRPEEPRGETCDNFTDIDNLVFEPMFEKYARPAFAPVGLMLEVWDYSFPAGSTQQRHLFVINDLAEPWSGTVRIFFEAAGQRTEEQLLKLSAASYESRRNAVEFEVPASPGIYDLVAEIEHRGDKIRSVRQIHVR
jgi:hypothetical protein